MNGITIAIREIMRGNNPLISYTKFDTWCKEWLDNNIEQVMDFVGIDHIPQIRFIDKVISENGVLTFGITHPIAPIEGDSTIHPNEYSKSLNPFISSSITFNTYNMLTYRWFVSKTAKILFIASVVHELTHYKQFIGNPQGFCYMLNNSYIKISKETNAEYKAQAVEAEAIESSKNFLRHKGLKEELLRFVI